MINRIYFLSSLPLIAVDLEKVEAISEDWVMFGSGKISTGGEKNAYDLRKVWKAYHENNKGSEFVVFNDVENALRAVNKVMDGKGHPEEYFCLKAEIRKLKEDCDTWYTNCKREKEKVAALEGAELELKNELMEKQKIINNLLVQQKWLIEFAAVQAVDLKDFASNTDRSLESWRMLPGELQVAIVESERELEE